MAVSFFFSVAVQPKADIQCLIHPALILRRDLPGTLAQAVNAYTLIKNKYFNSYQSMDIDKYIERASIK